MSLISPDYFKGPLAIAQRGQPSVNDDIANYITRYEQEFLVAALGYDLYNDFITGIAEDNPDQKWKDLNEGVVFKNTSGWWPAFYAANINRRPLYNNNQNMQWVGFAAGADAVNKPSPLAAYVYYNYMRDLNVQNAGIGFVKAKGEGSVTGNPALRLVDRWNNMSDAITVLWQLLATKGTSVYENYSLGNLDYGFFERQNIFGI